MTKSMFCAFAIIIFFISGSAMIWAQPMGPGMMRQGMMGRGYGMEPGTAYGGWNRMTLEQQKEWEGMRIEFWKDTLPLRQKLVAKQMELNILWHEENPDTDKATDLSNEISDLQAQLSKRGNEFLIQCRKKFGDQGWSCPGAGYYQDPEMMGQGYGTGPGMMGGMMGQGYGMGPGMMDPRYGRQYGPPQKPVEEKDAKDLLENYVKSTRNPNLKLGKIEDKGDHFEAEISTKDGSLVDKILVDKRTGWVRSLY